MNERDLDILLKLALTPTKEVAAPPDLGDEIYRALLQTPQRRARGWPLPWQPSPVMTTLWVVVLTGLLLAAFVASVAILQPSPGVPNVISMYHGGPERTGIMPGPGPAGTVEMGWSVSRGGPIPFSIMPVVAGDVVYVGDGSGALSALETGTGEERWITLLDDAITASPVLVDGLVIVGTEDGSVVALDGATGAESWRTDLEATVRASLAEVAGTVFVGTDAGDLVALEAASGARLWDVRVGGAVTRGAAIADGVAYVGAEGGRFMAIDVASQQVRWQVELGAGELATPAVANGLVYTATGLLDPTAAHELIALDVDDGAERWSFPAPNGEPMFVSAVDGAMVYAGSEDFSVYAVGAHSGEHAWTMETQGVVGSLGALVDGTLYIGSADRHVYAIDTATGREQWRIQVQGIPTIPAVIGGRVLVGTDLGMVTSIVGSEPERP